MVVLSLQCSCNKRLYDDWFREGKLIPLHLINQSLSHTFKFHSNLSLKQVALKDLLPCYRNILFFYVGKTESKPVNVCFQTFPCGFFQRLGEPKNSV